MNQHVRNWGQKLAGTAAVAGLCLGLVGCQTNPILEPRQMKEGMVPSPYQSPTAQRHKNSVISPWGQDSGATLPPVIGPMGTMPPIIAPPVVVTPPVKIRELPPPVKTEYRTYTVKKGDYLSKIAQMHKVSTDELASFNDMKKSDVLPVGKVLKLPPGSVAPDSSTVVQTPKGEPKWHVVESGEVLSRIASKYDVTVAELVKWNKLSSANTIFKGQKLAVNEAAAAGVKGTSASSSSSSSGSTTSSTTIKKDIPSSGIHKVEKNESWWSIAHQYRGLDSVKLREINSPKRTLHPGDIIYLTGDAAGKGTAGAAAALTGNQTAAATTGSAAELPQNNMYTVQAGDTLSGIAKKFRVSLSKLRNDNRLKTDLLMPGQTLMIYKEDAAAGTMTPTGRTDIPRAVTKSATATPPTVIPASRTILPHFVDQTSDTLEEIAEMYGSKVEWILEANPTIKTSQDLKKVKEIKVPVEDINIGTK